MNQLITAPAMVALPTRDGHLWVRLDQICAIEPTTEGGAVVFLLNGASRYVEATPDHVVDAMYDAVHALNDDDG